MCYAACWGMLGWTDVAADLKVGAPEKINSRAETELYILVIHVQRCTDIKNLRLVCKSARSIYISLNELKKPRVIIIRQSFFSLKEYVDIQRMKLTRVSEQTNSFFYVMLAFEKNNGQPFQRL